MPPRYAYWTILIDQKATAFRAREREELLPTLHQLRRKNSDVTLRWFAQGKLWQSPADAQAALRAPKPPRERRGREWRPGGAHRDPRDRFKKSAKPDAHRPHNSGPKPNSARTSSGPHGRDARGARKPGSGAARKPFGSKPAGPRKPWQRDRQMPRRQPGAPPIETAPSRPSPDAVAPKRKLPETE